MPAMSSQPSLFAEPERPTDRLFFGVFPPEPVQVRIIAIAEDLKAREGLRGRIHAPDRLHVTLFHVGDYVGLPNGVVEKCTAAASALRFAPFEATFDRARSFSSQPRNRPFTLQGGEGVETLIVMREAFRTEMLKAGLQRECRGSFVPHVTLLYDDKAVEETPVPPVSWTVENVMLVRSHLGQGRHEHLQVWPLRA
jgi:2'-5' RNA ligase